ncbi:MAG: hypothetical protein V4585_04815 [Bacteroidota bacterium]
MKITKSLGIWMDHSVAHLMALTGDTIETTIVHSAFSHQDKEETLNRSEQMMHNKEQHQEAEYYKTLGEAIRNYDDVLLFGPTDAKVELANILGIDHRFADIKIDVKTSDKMTENQEHAFVKDYFSKH